MTPTDQIKQLIYEKGSEHMSDEREEGFGRIEAEINDLKSENKITGFKIYRIEKSLDDMKEILERLTDVYNNQSMIQKDIVTLYKEVNDVRQEIDVNLRAVEPFHTEVVEHMTSVKTGTKIVLSLLTLLYGIGAWTINQTLTYAKENDIRIASMENYVIESKLSLEQLKADFIRVKTEDVEQSRSIMNELSKIRSALP